MSFKIEPIRLAVADIVVAPGSVLLKLKPLRPCKVGEAVAGVLGWEVAPGVVAIGQTYVKAGAVPLVLRIDDAATIEGVQGQAIAGFEILSPHLKLQTNSLSTILAAVRAWQCTVNFTPREERGYALPDAVPALNEDLPVAS